MYDVNNTEIDLKVLHIFLRRFDHAETLCSNKNTFVSNGEECTLSISKLPLEGLSRNSVVRITDSARYDLKSAKRP